RRIGARVPRAWPVGGAATHAPGLHADDPARHDHAPARPPALTEQADRPGQSDQRHEAECPDCPHAIPLVTSHAAVVMMPERPHRPRRHSGLRLSRNACMPSAASGSWLAAAMTSIAYAYALGWSRSICA